MKLYQRLILASAIPWLWIGAAQAGTSDVPTQQVAAPQAAQMLPFDLAASAAPSPPRTREKWLSKKKINVWLPSHLELRKGAGLAMSRPIRVGRKDLQLGVAGPVLRKKKLGLTVEVRF